LEGTLLSPHIKIYESRNDLNNNLQNERYIRYYFRIIINILKQATQKERIYNENVEK